MSAIKILSVSDIELGIIYSPQIVDRFGDIDVVVSSEDLPYYYLEYIVSMLDVPLYYVRGNHAHPVEMGSNGPRSSPWGAIDLHARTTRDDTGLLLAGIEGSVRYNRGPYQYTQSEMWGHVFRLIPGLYWNKLRHGRYLDVFVTHASPWGIHDMEDLPHHGIKAFRWLIQVFQPRLHLHGHIHVYRRDTPTQTEAGATAVVNTYGFRETVLDEPQLKPIRQPRRLFYRGEPPC